MIGFFPEMYPDELLYSTFARFYNRSGYCSDAEARADLFENPRLPIDLFLCNPLTKDAEQILFQERTTGRMLEKHTMLPLYIRFAGKLVKQKMMNFHEGIFIPNYERKHREILCYCPACATEDRNRYGETYWHRCHQIPETPICECHHCRLIRYRVDRRHLISAEQAIGENLISSLPVKNQQEIAVARYVKSVFETDMHLEDSISVKPFLLARLRRTPYESTSGHINAEMLRRDITNRFRIPSAQSWEPETVFHENADFYGICLLALFLGISPRELCEHTDTVESKQIGLPRIKSSRPGNKPIDWKAADEQLYPCVQAAIREIRNGACSRAQITKGTIERYLGLKPKMISKMPKCRTLVEAEQEK